MPINPTPPDERPASPPLHQSFWFPVAPEPDPESSQGEPDESLVTCITPPAPAPLPGLGWKAPKRVRVPIFGRDAADENTTPAAPHAGPRVPTANDETVRQLREHIVPPGLVDYDPDFQEVVHAAAAPEPDNPPPKEAESAQASIDPCDRDDATPNDGVVPQGIQVNIDGGGQDDLFACCLWSNGEFTIRPSDGEPLVLNPSDSRALVRYVSEVLSARARAAA